MLLTLRLSLLAIDLNFSQPTNLQSCAGVHSYLQCPNNQSNVTLGSNVLYLHCRWVKELA